MASGDINIYDVVKSGCLVAATLSFTAVCYKVCSVLKSAQDLLNEGTRIGRGIKEEELNEIIAHLYRSSNNIDEITSRINGEGIRFILSPKPPKLI